MIKWIYATILSLAVTAIICFPLIVVVIGVFVPQSYWSHVAVTSLGLFLCYLVKPVSILTGKNYKLF